MSKCAGVMLFDWGVISTFFMIRLSVFGLIERCSGSGSEMVLMSCFMWWRIFLRWSMLLVSVRRFLSVFGRSILIIVQ